MFIKKIIFTIILSILFTFNCYSNSIISNNEYTTVMENNKMKIKTNLYDNLKNDEKEALDAFKKIVNSFIDFNINDISNNLYNINSNNIDRFTNFVNEYPNSVNVLSKYFSGTDVKILNYSNNNSVITFNTEVSIYDLKKLVTKAAPKFIAKNFLSLMKGKEGINNKVINSLLECIGNELNKNNNELVAFNYNFEFKKENNVYKLSNYLTIINDIQKYVESLYSNILNKK